MGSTPALRQLVGHRRSEKVAAIGPDHDAADVARNERGHRSDRVQVVASVGEERAVAAVEATAVDEQRPMAVIECCPLDFVLREVKLWKAIGEPVEELQAVGVGAIHFPAV
jgi:hypothetical protein